MLCSLTGWGVLFPHYCKWGTYFSYCDFHNYEYTEVRIPTCKTAFSLPSINDNQSVPLIFLTDGSENVNSNGQLQRRCPRNNENRSNVYKFHLFPLSNNCTYFSEEPDAQKEPDDWKEPDD